MTGRYSMSHAQVTATPLPPRPMYQIGQLCPCLLYTSVAQIFVDAGLVDDVDTFLSCANGNDGTRCV